MTAGPVRRRPRRHGRPLQRRTASARRTTGRQIAGRLGVLTGLALLLTGVGVFLRAALTGVSGEAFFTAREVRVEGTRFLDPAELLALACPDTLLSGEIGSAELALLGERLTAHPLIERVAVHRSLPAAVVIEVTERVPVAFLTGRPIAGVDAAGRILTGLEPSRYGALPFITGLPEAAEARTEALARSVATIAALEAVAPRLLDTVSEVRPGPAGVVSLVLSTDAVVVRLPQDRLTDLLPLVGALVEEGRRRHAPLAEVDLRFDGTVIFRDRKGGG